MGQVSANVERCLSAVENSRCATVRAHEDAVSVLCGALCRAMGLESGTIVVTQFAAGLHDIGKIILPDAVLKNTGPLDPTDWAAMREHTKRGFDILWSSDDPLVKMAAIVAHCHHERWDGSGYPDGLAGEAIPPQARIVGLCDVYQALRESRPYKAPHGHEEALHIILEGDESGRTRPSHFDPVAHAAFRAHSDLIRDVYDGFTAGGVRNQEPLQKLA